MAYSIVAVQALNLSYHYPIIFWNTACLIVDSDGMEDEMEIEEDEEEIIDEDALIDEPEEKVKKKVKPVKYDKISSAIGKMKQAGVAIKPPDINKSTFTFVPDIDNNQIIYGIKGITRVNNDYANEIIANRPYSSFEDFLSRVKSTKLQIINLIKSGAFDNISNQTREELMNQYAISISDCKKKLTLQNMPTLVARNLIPEEYDRVKKVFNFNKFLKKNKFKEYYCLDQYSQDFFSDNFNADLLEFEDGKCVLLQKTWDKIYKKEMDVIRPYLAEPSTLEKLNKSLIEDQLGKYCEGTTSKWEMDSIGFYNGAHELDGINLEQYDIIDYFDLPEDPVVTKVLNFDGKQVPIFEISRIAGTILGKDKLKNVVTILTKEGVVKVKIYKPQFVKYDKQIFTKDEETGKKKIIERSWFTRGNKIIFTGIKRGDNFVPKKYKGTPYPVIELVTEIDYKNNRLKTISERNDA